MSSIRVDYDLFPPRLKEAEAISFNVSDWTKIVELPDMTAFTAHSRELSNGATVNAAYCEFALQNVSGNSEARIIGMNYVNGVQTWYTNWGSVVHNTGNNIQLLAQDFTSGLAAVLAAAPNYVYLMAQVKGNGKIYLARPKLTWGV